MVFIFDFMPMIISISQLLFGAGLFIWLFLVYRKNKYQTVKYLLIATTILLTAQFITAVFTSSFRIGDLNPDAVPTIMWALLSVSELIATFCLLLFFEAFMSERVLTKRNNLVLMIITSVSTGIIGFGVVVTRIFSELSIGLDNLDEVFILLDASEYIVTGMFTFFLTMGGIISVVMGILLFKNLMKLRKKTRDQEISKSITKMSIVVLLLTIAPILLSSAVQTHISGQIGVLIILVCIGVFFIFYMRGGMFNIQSQSLRRLLIINQGGIPVYSYVFQHFDKPKKEETTVEMADEDQELLFSGALKAISILLEEFTGTNHTIEEIFFGNLLMMIKQCRDLSIVLVADESSIFFREALESFSKQLHKTIPDINQIFNFTKEQTTKASLLLEHQFGVGGKTDMHWLKRFKPAGTAATNL
ncbi:MAG: hypothetical protein H7647_00215 [Candidatus Heimdallarchaeota archaeon]|nr:hypothetical protein [Candidatus Heimdallarchaeota archaeon]MCK4252858.1 hypothetical protein [Candidatus Heimdallarchaeota archaeon]